MICRDLYCTECKTIQGFTLITVTGWKHYHCNKCDSFTEMQFVGQPYERDKQMKRIEQVIDFEVDS